MLSEKAFLVRDFIIYSLSFPLNEDVYRWRKQMAFKAGDRAFIIENHSHVAPVIIVRSYGDFYTVALGGKGINLRASRLFGTREEAEKQLPRWAADRPAGRPVAGCASPSPYDYLNFRSPYGI